MNLTGLLIKSHNWFFCTYNKLISIHKSFKSTLFRITNRTMALNRSLITKQYIELRSTKNSYSDTYLQSAWASLFILAYCTERSYKQNLNKSTINLLVFVEVANNAPRTIIGNHLKLLLLPPCAFPIGTVSVMLVFFLKHPF